MKILQKISTAILFTIMLITLLISVKINPETSLYISISLVILMELISYFAPNSAMAVTICGGIAGNIAFNCDAPLQAGTEDRLILYNKADIEGYTLAALNEMVVTDLTLGATKTGFTISGRRNSNAPSWALIPGTITDQFDHIINFKALDLSPASKLVLQGMVGGLYVAVVENKGRGTAGNTAFEIYGLDAGMELNVMTRNPNDTATNGAVDVTVQSGEISKEPKLPRTWFDTSYAATKVLVDATLA